MEDNLNERQPELKTKSMEDNLNGRQHQRALQEADDISLPN